MLLDHASAGDMHVGDEVYLHTVRSSGFFRKHDEEEDIPAGNDNLLACTSVPRKDNADA
jgi:hypothetical protein